VNSSSNSVHRKSAIGCLLGTAVASILLFGQAQVASAGVASVWVNDGSGWILVATDPTGALASVSSYTTLNGAFTLTNVSATSTNGPNAELFSSAFHIEHKSAGTDNLGIAFVGTGYTAPTLAPIDVTSQVSGGNDQGVLTSLTFQSYVDPTNNGDPALLAGGQGLQIPTLFPSIGGAGASLSTTIFSNLNSPFSVTELSTLGMTDTGLIVSLGGDTTLKNVPEPSSITLLCVGFTALGGYGWKRRRRQLRRP
jgi:hypothetical protein